jgi:hypothetical protein
MVAVARRANDERRHTAMPVATGRPRLDATLQLARTETRKLLLHPTFLGGLALLVVATRGMVGGGGTGELLPIVFAGLAVGIFAGTLLAANASALRARRDRMGELFGSLPAPPETRTAAILLAVVAGPAVVAAVGVLVAYPIFHADPDTRAAVDLALLAQFPLTVMALGALGVALARWIPHPAVGPVVLVAHVMTGIIWVVPWIAPELSGIRLGWHYSYLVSAIILWASLALARDRLRASTVAVATIALGAMVTSALLQVPPGGLQ